MNNRRFYAGVLAALAGLVLTSSMAMAQGRLSGTVKDADGGAIIGVEIQLVPSDAKLPTVKVSSDKKGRFIFGLIRRSNYRVAAIKEGWRVTQLDGNIAVPDDESEWAYKGPVGPGVEPPELSIRGASQVTYHLVMEPDSGGPGQWGTGVPLLALDEVLKKIDGGHAAEASEELRRRLIAEPNSANVNYLLGWALLASEDYDGAASATSRALEIDPQFQGANMLMGKVLEHQGKQAEAAECYALEAAGAKDPGVKHDALLASAVLAITMGDNNKAVAALEEVIEINPEDVAALRELGNLYLQMGEKEKAAATLEKVAGLGGADDPAVLYNLGADAYNNKEYEKAASLFEKAVAANDEFAEAHLLLGNSKLNLGDMPGAVESFQRFLELKPDHPQAAFAQQMVDALAGS